MVDRDLNNQQENNVEDKQTSTITPDNSSESSQWKDQFLRVTADFQNYKKRVERERADIVKYAQIGLIEKLLPLIDDLERALMVSSSHATQGEMQSWLEGLSLIDKKLHKFLSDLSIEEIPASGQFNPQFHEALIHVDAPDKTTGEIVEVLSKGYKLGDAIIRHAKVSVAK